MKNCDFNQRIDDFLLDRMNGPDRERFEEHLFNCDRCFRDASERWTILTTVRAHGRKLFSAEAAPKPRPRAAFLRLWPYATAAVAVLIAVWIGINPGRPAPSLLPLTAPVDDTVRGGSVELVSPLGALTTSPSALGWKSAGTEVSYSITLTGPGLNWTGDASEARIDLPADVRSRLVAGVEYRWKVKAFARQGGFLGASQEGVFRIAN